MNFRRIGVVATASLEAEFALEDIQTNVAHNEVWTELDYDYEINAEFCDGLPPSTVFVQGSAFELCVSTPANAFYHVDSINRLVMTQEGTGSVAVLLIADHEDSLYARTDCVDGSCRILIQIPVLFHTGESVTALMLHGSATLAFSKNSTHNVRRHLYEDDKVDRLPETSTGFRAQVFVSYPGEDDNGSGAHCFFCCAIHVFLVVVFAAANLF